MEATENGIYVIWRGGEMSGLVGKVFVIWGEKPCYAERKLGCIIPSFFLWQAHDCAGKDTVDDGGVHSRDEGMEE